MNVGLDWLGFFSGLLRACELLEPEYLVLMLKAVKHLSMNATLLEVLQNTNALEILVRILDEHSSGPHSTVSRLNSSPPTLQTPLFRKSPTTFFRHASIFAV